MIRLVGRVYVKFYRIISLELWGFSLSPSLSIIISIATNKKKAKNAVLAREYYAFIRKFIIYGNKI